MTTNIVYPPLIITLKTDERAQEYFSALRKARFPAYANYLDAHITLFHKLPSDISSIYDTLTALSDQGSF